MSRDKTQISEKKLAFSIDSFLLEYSKTIEWTSYNAKQHIIFAKW